MGPVGCPETSVRNYNYTPRNNSEERSSLLFVRNVTAKYIRFMTGLYINFNLCYFVAVNKYSPYKLEVHALY
jgi:hypothetical protein